MTTRRQILHLALGMPVLPLNAFAQSPTGKVWRVGVLVARTRPASIDADYIGGFVRGMRELGYVEGKNLVLEWRFADAKVERLPALAAELVNLKVDVIMAAGTQPTRAAQQATTTIPIIIGNTSDPVGSGFVQSLARPGGNITGASSVSGEIHGKQLEMLRSISPKLSRLALLFNPTNNSLAKTTKYIEEVAPRVGISVLPVAAQGAQQLEAAFAQMIKERAGGIIIVSDAILNQQTHQIAKLALQHRLPAIATWGEFPEGGGLMSYGPKHDASYRLAATYVDKILKGAKPADLPVQQPTLFELVLNRKTAKALGLTIPHELMLRAETVIE